MLRRITAAAFTLAALTMSIGATSATADDYGPDEFWCTIEVSDTVVPVGTPVDITVSCTEDTTGTVLLIDEDGNIVDSAPATIEGGDNATLNGAAGDAITVEPAVMNVASAGLAAPQVSTAVVQTVDVDAAAVEPVSLEDADGEATFTATDLEPGDYLVRFVDEADDDLADPAGFTVIPGPDDGDLAATGATGLPYLAVAGGLLLAGITALVAIRRARGKA